MYLNRLEPLSWTEYLDWNQAREDYTLWDTVFPRVGAFYFPSHSSPDSDWPFTEREQRHHKLNLKHRKVVMWWPQLVHRPTLCHVIASYDRGFMKKGGGWRERDREMKGGGKREAQRDRDKYGERIPPPKWKSEPVESGRWWLVRRLGSMKK